MSSDPNATQVSSQAEPPSSNTLHDAASSASASAAPTQIKQEEVDQPSIEADPSAPLDGPSQPDPMNLDGANDMDTSGGANATNSAPGAPDGMSGPPPAAELRIPTKKDASLREFLGKMDDYAPISSPPYSRMWNKVTDSSDCLQIPDAVTNYYLTLAGLPPPPETPPQLARLLALATQKFIADIAADAYQYSRIRSSNTTSNNPMGGLGGAAGFGTAGAPGAAATGGAASSKDGGAQGKGLNLGVQRPGYGGGGQGGSQGRTVLTMEDLGMAVGEYGVNVKRGEFYR
ncbi:transcription initiation factor-like protein TFIID subunit 10 [Phyllosticta citriasiana]|uniref:transcription initiation factor-like protein TFIID subunit 10 n=1 Tax=Phyllosticta citriasiana TaxID=595635 RepID=UPI0030FD9AB7